MYRTLALGLTTLLVCVPGAASAQPPRDFSGVWALDSIASDTLPDPPSSNSNSYLSRIAVVAAAPYSRFPEPYARSIYDPARVWEALDAIGERPVQLVLAATDTLVMISRDGAPPLGVRTDGEEIEKRIRGLSTEIRAKWDDGRLRIERTLPSGLEIRETWQLERPDRLTVRVKATGPIPREIDVRWVYRRCEEPAGPSEEPAGPSPAISKSSR